MTRHHYKSAGVHVAFTMRVLLIGAVSTACAIDSTQGFGNEVDGFTEPFKTVTVAVAETGTVRSIEVQEGDVVEKGQVLARLDDDVHQALLAIAQEGMNSQGQLKSAEAEVRMRRRRLEKLEELRVQGHAREEEVQRARADLEIAEARVLSATELREVKRLEHSKVQVQLSRRVIRAPIAGVVSMLHKDEGEFVAPNDPHVLELVSLDPLMATFNVPTRLLPQLNRVESVSVKFPSRKKTVKGVVAMIAPTTDAESSTVRVKVRIPNGEGGYRSGEQCTLQLTNPTTPVRRRTSS